MTTDELVAETNRLGITLTSNGEKLRVEAPMGALTDELRHALGEHKTEILARLTLLHQDTEALLDRLRNGQTWLLDQHRRWQSGDTTAVDDAEFSRVWNGWWALDQQLRDQHGFQGCVFAPDGSCPKGFPCQACADLPAPGVVAQLELGVS